MPALIFDCDGVLADTERFGHLPAFNATFAHFGLPVHWSEEEYGEKLRIGGGKERMATLFDDARLQSAGLPSDPGKRAEMLAEWHRYKTGVYTEIVRAGQLPARPGVVRLVDEALAAGWQLAVASTSAEESVRAVLTHVVGPQRADRFTVAAGDVVAAKKPDPAIYELTLSLLGIRAEEAIVIEDSRNGLVAAHAAGLPCVVTVNGYTEGEVMSEATMVVSGLGDQGEPMRVIVDRTDVHPEGEVALTDLAACLGSAVG